MKKKRAVSIIALLLIVLMLLSLMMSILPVTAFAVTQSDIDAVRQQRDELSNQVQEIQNRIDTLKDQQANVLEQKAALDEKNRLANEQLVLVAEEIDYYDDLIAEKTDELRKAINREEEQLQRYRARVRAMEESGGYNILALIISSKSFAEFLTAMDDMSEIMTSDRALEEQYIAAREETAEIKAELEGERAEYEAKQGELREEQAQLEREIEDAFAELASLKDEIEKAEKEYEAAQLAEASAAAEILRIIAQYDAEQRQKQEQQQPQQPQQPQGGDGTTGGDSGFSGGNSGSGWTDPSGGGDNASSGGGTGWGGAQSTGSLSWPVPCSTRITGRFAEARTGHSHAGIDIDGFGNDGNIIIAALDGTVVTSSYDSSYGNYVIIDHGNGMKTVYAHNSGNAVSKGSYVYQGQTIGYLGATGNARGTHCHFEVIIDGNRVDPAAYFSGLTYYNC